MPNWSYNTLTITGDGDELQKFKDAVGDYKEKTALSFDKIVPMPAHIFRGNLSMEDEAKYGKMNCWYEWSIENWGTKWNAGEVDLQVDNGRKLVYTFNTAWAPPTPVMIEASRQYPKLLFIMHSDEESGEYNFTAKFEKGEQLWEK